VSVLVPARIDGLRLWTRDRALAKAAAELELAYAAG
jgi:hypothetical protein